MTTLEDFFDDRVKLPSPPAIAVNILNAVKKEENSFEELAEIIQADPALTVRVLKTVNSSLYSVKHPVDSLPRAVSFLGTQALTNIALSFVIVQLFQGTHQGGFDLDLFWRRAISSAVAADVLGKTLSYNDNNLFVAGLLQDIGVLVRFLSDSVAFTEVLDRKRISGKPLNMEEKDQFGVDHAELGAHLLRTWNLSDAITGPIRYHHSPQADASHRDAAQIINFADKISAMYHGLQSSRKSIEVRNGLKQSYALEEGQITSIIDTIGEKSRDIIRCFSIEPGEMKPFSQIMQEANEELGRLNLSYEQIVLELKQAKQNAEQLAHDLKRANDSLRELAYRDQLTGLYNHRYFQEVFEIELQRSVRYGRPLSLLLVDLDFFKQINDNFGHLVGDRVLQGIGERMVKLVRRPDIVARYGGEEFVILLPETGLSGAKVIAQRLRRGIEQRPFTTEVKSLSLTVSIGVASTDMEDVAATRKTLLGRSDEALYRAKRNGRNRVEV